MKKFTKLFLSCALVSAVAAATASMAMAADGDINLKGDLTNSTYNPTSGVVTISTDDLDNLVNADQATLLVYKGKSSDVPTDTTIEGIDQAAGAGFDKTGLKNAPNEEANDGDTYTVKVGYYSQADGSATKEFKIAVGTFSFGGADVTRLLIGDTNGDYDLGTTDQTQLARKITGLDVRAEKPLSAGNAGKEATVATDSAITYTTGDGKYKVGDTNGDYDLGTTDQTQLARKITGLDVRAEKPLSAGDAGKYITVEKEDWTPTEPAQD